MPKDRPRSGLTLVGHHQNQKDERVSTSDPNASGDLSIYTYLDDSTDIMDFRSRIIKLVEHYGFSDFSFGRLQSVNVDGLLTTTPDDLFIEYNDNAYYTDDFTISNALGESPKPMFISSSLQVLESANNIGLSDPRIERNKEILQLIGQYGYAEYYNIPGKAANGNGNVLFSVTNRGHSPREVQLRVDHKRRYLHDLANAVDYISTKNFPDYFLDGDEPHEIILSNRALEVLDTFANVTQRINEIAEILKIQPGTVGEHLSNARCAFGAKDNVTAMRRAVLRKMITFRKW